MSATAVEERAPGSGGPEVRILLPRQPFLVGRSIGGASTIWFLRPTAPPVPGPWDVTLLLREA
jgi:hypothetical protein